MPLLGWFAFLCHQKWETEERLKEIMATKSVPRILFLSGARDEIIPPAQMRELFHIVEKRAKEKGKMVIFVNGTHNDTCIQPGYFEAIASFLSEVF